MLFRSCYLNNISKNFIDDPKKCWDSKTKRAYSPGSYTGLECSHIRSLITTLSVPPRKNFNSFSNLFGFLGFFNKIQIYPVELTGNGIFSSEYIKYYRKMFV